MTNYQALVNQYIAEHPSAGAEWGQIALQDFARWADDRRSHEPEKASVTNQNDGMQVGGGGFDLLSRLGHGDDLHKQARAEIEHLREVLTIPNITPDTTSSALFIRTLSEHEKGQPVNGQDLINALMWRVKNQRKEIARLQEKRRSPEPLPCAPDPRDAVIAELTKWADDWAVYRGPAEKPVDKGWRLAAEELQSILKKSAART